MGMNQYNKRKEEEKRNEKDWRKQKNGRRKGERSKKQSSQLAIYQHNNKIKRKMH